MAKVTYNPSEDPRDDMPEITEQFGHVFTSGDAVDVENPNYLKVFRGNPFFDVADDDGKAAKPAKRPM